MSIVVKGGTPKTIDLDDGLHKGKVILVEKRDVDGQDYSYLDLFIRLDDKELELKVGYPLPKAEDGISPKSALGKLIKRFTNADVIAGKDYDLELIFAGKGVQFQSVKGEEGFVEILKQTLKLSVPQTTEIKLEESQ